MSDDHMNDLGSPPMLGGEVEVATSAPPSAGAALLSVGLAENLAALGQQAAPQLDPAAASLMDVVSASPEGGGQPGPNLQDVWTLLQQVAQRQDAIWEVVTRLAVPVAGRSGRTVTRPSLTPLLRLLLPFLRHCKSSRVWRMPRWA